MSPLRVPRGANPRLRGLGDSEGFTTALLQLPVTLTSENKAAAPGPARHRVVPRRAGEERLGDPGDGKREVMGKESACLPGFCFLPLPFLPSIHPCPVSRSTQATRGASSTLPQPRRDCHSVELLLQG